MAIFQGPLEWNTNETKEKLDTRNKQKQVPMICFKAQLLSCYFITRQEEYSKEINCGTFVFYGQHLDYSRYCLFGGLIYCLCVCCAIPCVVDDNNEPKTNDIRVCVYV